MIPACMVPDRLFAGSPTSVGMQISTVLKVQYMCSERWHKILTSDRETHYYAHWKIFCVRTFSVMLFQAQWRSIPIGQFSLMWRTWAITTEAFHSGVLWFSIKNIEGAITSHRKKKMKISKKIFLVLKIIHIKNKSYTLELL